MLQVHHHTRIHHRLTYPCVSDLTSLTRRRVCAAVTINGTCKVGLNLLVFTIHPMKVGATLMSSFLFNVALVLLASTAVIQFCSQAFSLYAYQTAIYEIFSDQVKLNLVHTV